MVMCCDCKGPAGPDCRCREEALAKTAEKMKPLSPKDIEDSKILPDFVIEAVNDLLMKQAHDGHCTLTLKEVEKRIKDLSGGQKFERHWLNFESVYKKAGWKVEYDQPAFNETYEATYTFTKR